MEKQEIKKGSFGLVLGSGGARGFAHLGVLQALHENRLRPDFISGCSMGAIIGGLYAYGLTPFTIYQEALEMKRNEILELVPRPGVHNAGVYRTTRIRKKLETYLGHASFANLRTPFCCVATDLRRGTLDVLDGEDMDVIDSVIASSCLPGIFTPMPIGDALYVDGGVLSRVPVAAVKAMGADRVLAVDVSDRGGEEQEYERPLSVLYRCLEVMDKPNRSSRNAEDIPDLLLQPALGDMSQFKLKQIDFAFEQGYQEAMAHMDEILDLFAKKIA